MDKGLEYNDLDIESLGRAVNSLGIGSLTSDLDEDCNMTTNPTRPARTEYQSVLALVAEMRAIQKQYFKFRTDALLRQSKELEKRVDTAILELKKDAGQKQGALI